MNHSNMKPNQTEQSPKVVEDISLQQPNVSSATTFQELTVLVYSFLHDQWLVEKIVNNSKVKNDSHHNNHTINGQNGCVKEHDTTGDTGNVQYAEDLLIKLFSSSSLKSQNSNKEAPFHITPVALHLFGLRLQKPHIWLCPNQRLIDLCHEIYCGNTNELRLELRLRYLPFRSKDLFKYDPNAFNYYFSQIRYDFINFPKKKFDYLFDSLDNDSKSKDSLYQEIYGIALQDVLRIVLEDNIKVDESNIKKFVNDIYQNMPKHMPRPVLEMFFSLKSIVEDCFKNSYSKHKNPNHVKWCYIDQYLESLGFDYYDETFKVGFNNPKFNRPTKDRIATYMVNEQMLRIKGNKNKEKVAEYFIGELMDLTVLQSSNNSSSILDTAVNVNSAHELSKSSPPPLSKHQHNQSAIVQITFVTQPPINLEFDHVLQMKSFISLLSGYYRLSHKWNFELSKMYYSPWLSRLKSVCAHGPISVEFVREKLNRYCDIGPKIAPFLFHVSRHEYNTFFVVFKEKQYRVQAIIPQIPVIDSNSAGQITFLLETSKRLFNSHSELFNYLRDKEPCSVIVPNENDRPLSLLFCRKDTEQKDADQAIKNKPKLVVYPTDQIERTKLELTKTKLFSIRYGALNNGDKVMIKEFNQTNSSITMNNFLREIENWIHLQYSAIVCCKGIVMSPLSLLFEFCPSSLAELYQQRTVDETMMIQAAFSLGKALDYIYSRNLVHGYIRFENLFVFQCTKQCLRIKLGDPIGYRDRSFSTVTIDPVLAQFTSPFSSSLFSSNHSGTSFGTSNAFSSNLSSYKTDLHKNALFKSALSHNNATTTKSAFLPFSSPFGLESCNNLNTNSFATQTMSLVQQQDPDETWLPPEYFDISSCHFRQLTSFVDVYAYGSTVWQIFHNGQQPSKAVRENISAYTGPLLDNIRQLIEACWRRDFSSRMQPCSIFGHISRVLNEDYQMRYQSILEQPSQQLSYDSTHSGLQRHKSSLSVISRSKHNFQNHNNIRSNLNNLFTTSYFHNFRFWGSTRSKLSDKPRGSTCSLTSGQTDITSVNIGAFEDSLSLHQSFSDNFKSFALEHIHHRDMHNFREIGSGNYGKVLQAIYCKKDTNDGHFSQQLVAIKIINEAKSLAEEISIMAKLKHKNIAQVIGYCYLDLNKISNEDDQDDSSCSEYCSSPTPGSVNGLVMEYLALGSLEKYVSKRYEEKELDLPFIKFATDVAEGMVFLSSKNIIHRDLAARNILVKSPTELKISDFGLSHIVDNDVYKTKTARSIPLKWYAPESILDNLFYTKSDVWSFGVLLWEIYTFGRQDPYDILGTTEPLHHPLYNYLKSGCRLAQPVHCPDSMYEVMMSCWNFDINQRPSFQEVLNQLLQLNEFLSKP